MLYIVSDADALSSGLFPKTSPDWDTTIVLIEDGVLLKDVPGTRVFALAEDAVSRRVTPSFPLVSYVDMLKLMFEAERVVAL
jgi:hypothetical protein